MVYLLIEEICWILDFAKPAVVFVDKEYAHTVMEYKCKRIIVDDDTDGESGEYEDVVRKGMEIDVKRGGKGWDDLVIDDVEETDTMIMCCTSGTTSSPKVSSLYLYADYSLWKRHIEGPILLQYRISSSPGSILSHHLARAFANISGLFRCFTVLGGHFHGALRQ
jgi:acyl-CoA synthetase (AMP-forming)/AMP-acid ligase II